MYYWVLVKKIKTDFFFFKIMLTWKIVVPAKASVLYIYIDKRNTWVYD